MSRGLYRAALALGLACASLAPARANGPELPVIALTAGMYRIEAEVAATPQEMQTGLMHRESLPDSRGMLFMFRQPGTQCMWMRNTLIPLSVAFLRDDGTIVNIEDMAPQTETSHCSTEPVRTALEMNAGWFDKRGLKPGATIRGIPMR
ncbi:DUF192 domain-containing protein [Verticiella sediminum]|uniref:DUF192 domain-containing protein n=1 Tax=Verticiella sediminum TaxID=1247510 RepID=A0A556AC40_9BURK|nr:DUF192 domain-containing protein [Verticiella sediminum]TSH90437.1 DUF192 domain-containing protein [Verticiella sediminum]